MKTVILGSSELAVSRMAYGCWRVTGVVQTAPIDSDRERYGLKAIQAAYEANFTLFDLADVYSNGQAEELFGQALKEIPGMQKHILIATKCGVRKASLPDKNSPYRYDSSRAHIIESCEQSLKRLGVETIDLYQIHRPDYLMEPEEVAAAFETLRQSGKAREFGVSNFSPAQFDLLRKACSVPLVSNQVEISLCHLDALHDGTVEHCRNHALTPLAWSPLAKGELGSEYPIALTDPNHVHRQTIRDTLNMIARERGCSRTSVALAWLMRHPAGIIPIIGSTNPEHIHDATDAEKQDLSREEWYRLMQVAYGEKLP